MKHDADILNSGNETKAMWKIVKNTTTSFWNPVENVVLKVNDREVNNSPTLACLLTKTFRE